TLAVAFGSYGAWRFAEALGAPTAARWVASASLAGSAWLSCELHNGISEAVNLGPMALALAYTAEALQAGPGARPWVKVGLGVGLSAIVSPYLGLATGVCVLVRALTAWRWAWAAALTAVVLASPTIYALGAQLQHPFAIIKHPPEMNALLAAHNAVDPRAFFAPLGFRSVDLSAEGFEHSPYLGLVALGLGVVGIWSAPRRGPPLAWALAGIACATLALGPYLYWDGAFVELGGRKLMLPWAFVQSAIPGLAITHPLRLAAPTLVVCAGLAALGAARLGAWAGWLVVPVLLDGLLLSGAPWPVTVSPAKIPAVYAQIPSDDGIVLDLPTDAGTTMSTSRYLYYQTAHGHPIPYAPDARAATSPLLRRASFRALAAMCRRRADEQTRLGFDGGPQDVVRREDLTAEGVRYVVLHRELDPHVTPALRAALEAGLGPGVELGDTILWDLRTAP
ncbi:hypothetical protein L6R49_29780, partial [Myxococcota bacterium]|nr:hypothetical protein [Myxococcota bacterium]